LVPASSRNAANDAAWPMQIVETSGLMNCMVSYTANPDATSPPGELM